MTQETDAMASAELYLCLSRALLTPHHQVSLEELREGLVWDLRELGEQLPAITPEWLTGFEAALAPIESSERLLLGYSRLFLTPPAPAPLNLGVYLDGANMGRTSRLIEALYFRHQLEKSPELRELPDHLSLNLQWFAWVLSQWLEAQTGDGPAEIDTLHDLQVMARDFTLPAIKGMQQKIAAAPGATNPEQQLWQRLVELTGRQLAQDLATWTPLVAQYAGILSSVFPEAPGETADSKELSPEDDNSYGKYAVAAKPLVCRACGNTFVPDATLAEMRERLEAAGLGVDHLAVCAGCREVDTSSAAMTPPGASLTPWK